LYHLPEPLVDEWRGASAPSERARQRPWSHQDIIAEAFRGLFDRKKSMQAYAHGFNPDATTWGVPLLDRMPRKIRALIKELEKAGWMLDHFTGNHRIFKHPKVAGHVSLFGKKGADAQRYQERLVKGRPHASTARR
jgi:predicted RNA binding protein YcfA (HicA-like mRNA interferase family)